MRQRQSQTERHGRGESEVLKMVLARWRSQALPFVTYSTQVRDHQFVAEVRRNRSKTIVSFHRTTSTLVCLGQWPWAGARSARVSDCHEWSNGYPQNNRLSHTRYAWLATPARSEHPQWRGQRFPRRRRRCDRSTSGQVFPDEYRSSPKHSWTIRSRRSSSPSPAFYRPGMRRHRFRFPLPRGLRARGEWPDLPPAP